MNCVVCAIAKNEHLYINDWVKHYIDLGFSHIFLYDNDDKSSPYILDSIDKEYKSFITVIDKREIKEQGLQKKLYKNFYMSKKDTFDWCLFCDIDEYLFGIDNINNFLNDSKFNNFNQIRIKWKLFGDDDLVERDVKVPVYEAFKNEIKNNDLSCQGKSIIRGHLDKVFFNSVHYGAKDENETILKSCLPSGKESTSKVEIIEDYTNESVFMHHYMTKTISEFINQKYKRGDAIFKNREIDLSYFWNINLKTDEKIDWLLTNNIITDVVDLVIPYVDSSDKEWQTLFDKYNNSNTSKEEVNARNRFRGQGDFFRFWFRCIEKNMSWINKIFLIVQSKSQIPQWLDTARVNIVYHKDFIPKEYLPTFNSTCIEMFLWNIPGLSERFIYANDDFYAIDKLSKSWFFDDNKAIVEPKMINASKSMYLQHCLNGYCLAFNLDTSKTFFKFKHCMRPYFKSIMEIAFNENKDAILKSLSRFRENKNINIYYFDNYQIKQNYQLQMKENTIKCETITIDLNDKKKESYLNNCNIVAIQDTATDSRRNIYQEYILTNWFTKHFSKKSCFEKTDFNFNSRVSTLATGELRQIQLKKEWYEKAIWHGWVTREEYDEFKKKYGL